MTWATRLLKIRSRSVTSMRRCCIYFCSVVLVTAIALGIMTLFRPTMAYPVKEWLGLERRPQATPNSFYSVRIVPLFEEHCTGCHGSKRQKAKLRLESYAKR